jgi:hypothetical protein
LAATTAAVMPFKTAAVGGGSQHSCWSRSTVAHA